MRRIFTFLSEMEKAPPCKNREEAFDLVKKLWIDANLSMNATKSELRSFIDLQLHKEHGWQDLDRDPCYLPSIQQTDVRLYLHLDGTIVIQRMEPGVHPILLHKLGANRLKGITLQPTEQRTPCKAS